MQSHNIILKYFPELTKVQVDQFVQLKDLYEDWNNKINVISRKDVDNLYIHHVLHSLAIAKVIRFKPGINVLDVGTGGGFPGIPLAIFFPEVHFHLVDSIGKKIMVVAEISKALGLKNVTAVKLRLDTSLPKWRRTEGEAFDFVVTRAVSTLKELYDWTHKLINRSSQHEFKNGILCLKGGDLKDEIQELKKSVIQYELSNYFEEDFFKTKKLIYIPE